jgi:apolipoprotein D and lipocalin family protein
MEKKRTLLMLISLLVLAGCTGIPEGLEPVKGFQVERYLGRWYEIARLDHSFERGLSNVRADYTLRDDGDITVLNRGYDDSRGEWKEAKGIARVLGERDVGSLKVSFFRPLWTGYHVIALDQEGYRYALVTSASRSYLWILSRTKTLDEQILSELVSKAKAWGFETETLISVRHDRDAD